MNGAPFSSRNGALAHSARHDLGGKVGRWSLPTGNRDYARQSRVVRSVSLFLSGDDCFPRWEMVPSLSSPVRVLPAPRRLRAAQQSCQDMTSHVLTTSQLQSSRHASCRHHSSCHDQRRRRLARQGPVCNVTITMSASSIAQRQTCCQATASWFVDEYGT